MSPLPQKLCRECQRPLMLIEERTGICQRVACQHSAYQKSAGERFRARDAAFEELYQLGRRRELVEDPEQYFVAHIPSQGRELGPLPDHRGEAFLTLLDQLLAASEESEETTPAEPPVPGPVAMPLSAEQEAVSVQACIGCKGHCCQTAGSHGWQDLHSIRRYREVNPGLSREEIRASYAAVLGSAPTYIDSCVFHGVRGCLLPREMRSWLCNTYWCGELRMVQGRIEDGAPAKVLMAWPRSNGQLAVAFVTPTGAAVVEDPENPR
jgi:hypothetical protein